MTNYGRKVAFSLLCIALAVALVLPGLCTQAHAATDFSGRGYASATVSAVEFLRDELGLQLTPQEANYLAAHPDFSVVYGTSIPSGRITAVFDGQNVAVTPRSYTYTANNGTHITWQPADVDGTPLVNGTATVPAGSEDFVTVGYTAQLTLDKASVNKLLNTYYNAAKAQSDRLKQHNAEVAAYEQYTEELATYNNVLLPRYEQYMDEYRAWKLKDDPYQAYLKELAAYQRELEEYNNFDPDAAEKQWQEEMVRYRQYVVELEEYNRQYAEYLEQMSSPELVKISAHLKTLEYMLAECQNRSLRSAITGSTVTMVLSRKQELIAAGIANGKDLSSAINTADYATRNLRNLISEYEKCTDDESRYAFYATTYSELRRNFCNLLRMLDYFYRQGLIHDFIVSQGKDLPYRILLAQLYEICNALDNGAIENYEQYYNTRGSKGYFDSNYRIDGLTPESILGDCLLEDANDATPLKNGATLIPQEPVKPAEVPVPERKQRPPLPIAPVEVPEPGPAPAVVPEPQPPTVVPEPAPYLPTQEESELQRTFDSGLQPRTELQQDYLFTVHTTVKKYFRNVDMVSVFFHASENADPYPVEGERGSFIEYPPDLDQPSKTVEGYTCTFAGWVYEDGTDVDWAHLREGSELHVYPRFEQTPNLYNVVWVVDGERITAQTPFGEVPEFDGVPQKAADANGRIYRFTGWDRPLQPMTTEGATYTAQFEAAWLIGWVIDGQTTFTNVWNGDMPTPPVETPTKELSDRFAYTFNRWEPAIAAAHADAEYTAQFDRVKAIADPNGFSALVERQEASEGAEARYVAEMTYSSDRLLDISVLFDNAQRNGLGVCIRLNNHSVEFSAADVSNAYAAGVRAMTLYYATTGYKEYAYKLSLLNEQHREVDCGAQPRLTVTAQLSATNSRLYRVSDEGETPTRITIEQKNDATTATMYVLPNFRYEVRTRFSVTVAAAFAEMLSMDVSDELRRNTVVTVKVLEAPVGMRFVRVYAVDAEGNEVEVTDNQFKLPESDVTLFADLLPIEYTITFYSEGIPVGTRKVRYGETVVPPANPTKAPDGEFTYEFECWEGFDPLAPVAADAEYHAKFKAVPIPELVEGGGDGMSKLMKLLIAAAVTGGVLLVAAAVGIPLLIVHNRRKRAAKRAAENAARTANSSSEPAASITEQSTQQPNAADNTAAGKKGKKS